MYIFQVIAICIFVFGYFIISVEHRTRINKAAVAIMMGGILWIIVSLSGVDFKEELALAGADVFGLIIFLLSAMSLVEVLVHYKFFDILRGKLFALKIDDKKQFVIIYFIAFFLSAAVDNLTATIVMVQMSRKFFKGENLIMVAAGIVIATNAGGAFSPIGDVTTIMLWLGGKFGAIDVITRGFLPSLALAVTALAIMRKNITNNSEDSENEIITKLSPSEKLVICLVFISFTFPLAMNMLKLPPYIGLLIGLGIVWIVVGILKRIKPYNHTHFNASIERCLKKSDIPSLEFFTGILLSVSALQNLHVLEYLSILLYGNDPSFSRVVFGSVGLGMISAIVDNVPLTAIAMQVLNIDIASLWVLMALTLGTGGSLLSIGSAAGIVAMGIIKELTFEKYIKIAFIPALVGFITAVCVWYIQYLLF